LGTNDNHDRGDDPNEMGDNLKVVALGAGRSAKSVSQAGDQTCAVLDDGELKCWGSNVYGQLGQEDGVDHFSADPMPAVKLGGGRTATTVSAGVGFSTCALMDNKTAKCWGYSGFQLLSAPAADRGGFSEAIGDFPGEISGLPALNFGGHLVKSIGTGTYNACAILDDDTVRCWGKGDQGQLGRGDPAIHGNTPETLGSMAPVDFGGDHTAKAISVAAFHVCVLTKDGTVKCWGDNTYGQLGIGSVANQGDNAGEMGEALQAVPLPRKAVQVSAGRWHTCALLDDATVMCWGYNASGQLGVGDNVDRQSGLTGFPLKAVDLAF
jgi:alpha-tubulin suppressor-like RCC1 family protein